MLSSWITPSTKDMPQNQLVYKHQDLGISPPHPHPPPHHGVYHPHKPDKIWVLFDCSSEFQERSLNKELLSAPDLTKQIGGVL